MWLNHFVIIKKYILFFSFLLSYTLLLGQEKFSVVILIDDVYKFEDGDSGAHPLDGILNSWQLNSLIEENYVKIKMSSQGNVDLKSLHKNGKYSTEVVQEANAKCTPCDRLMKESENWSPRYYVCTSNSNANGTCHLGIDDYTAISTKTNLADLIKQERKKAKKSKQPVKMIVWKPSITPFSFDLQLTTDTTTKLTCGDRINFKINSSSGVSQLRLYWNDELQATNEVTESIESTDISFILTKNAFFKLVSLTCPNSEPKTLSVMLDKPCDEKQLVPVRLDLTYKSRKNTSEVKKLVLGVFKAKEKTNDKIAKYYITLINKDKYLFVLDNQPLFSGYEIVLVDQKEPEKELRYPLIESSPESDIHLESVDKTRKSVWYLDAKEISNELNKYMKTDELNKYMETDKTDVIFDMYIVPQGVKGDFIKDNELEKFKSETKVVVFQKC